MRQTFIPEFREPLFAFYPSFPLLLVLFTQHVLHFPCFFCSWLTLPPPSLLFIPSPFPSGSPSASSEPLRDVLLSRSFLQIGFTLSIFLLSSFPHACCIPTFLLLFLLLCHLSLIVSWMFVEYSWKTKRKKVKM